MPPRGSLPGARFIPRRQRIRSVSALHRQRNILGRGYARRIDRTFDRQAAAIVRAYLAGTPPDSFGPILARESLEAVSNRVIGEAAIQLSLIPAELVGVEALAAGDLGVLRLIAQAGTRIRQIDQGTLAAVRRTIGAGHLRGYSNFQIAEGVAQDGFRGLNSVVRQTYRNRAQAIARTEMGFANQGAAHDRYRAAGVTHLEIIDGTSPTICGWTHHDDPDVANGSIRTVDEGDRYPLAHPNCRRVSMPVLSRIRAM